MSLAYLVKRQDCLVWINSYIEIGNIARTRVDWVAPVSIYRRLLSHSELSMRNATQLKINKLAGVLRHNWALISF